MKPRFSRSLTSQAATSLDAEIGNETAELVDKYSRSDKAVDIIARLKGEMGMTDLL